VNNSLENSENNFFRKLKSNPPLALAIIFAAGIRILYWVQFQSSDLGPILLVDAEGYHLKALKLLTKGWLGDSAFYQAPLYPYFLAMIYKIFGQKILIVQGIQIALSTGTVWLIYKIGESLFNRKVAILSAVFCAIYGPFIFYSILVLKVTLSLFFSCLFILALLRSCDSSKNSTIFFGGILLGINIALRGNYLLLYPATALWILFAFPKIKAGKRLINLFIFTLGMTLCVFPMTLRNYILSGDVVVTSYQAGANFYIGNNPDAKGNYTVLEYVRANPEFEETDFRRKAETLEGQPLKPSEVSRFWFKKTLNFITNYPTKFIQLLGTKSFLFFNNYEIPDNYDYQFLKTLIPSLNAGILSFGIVFLLAASGIILFLWTGPKFYLIYGFIVTYAASVILFFVTSRYRIPIAPILLPFAATFALSGIKQIRNINQKRLTFLGFFLVLMALIAFKPISLVDFAFSYKNMGLAYEKRELFEEALRLYQNAEKIKPDDAKAIHHMGVIFLKTGNIQKAKETFLKSIQLNPKLAEAHFSLAETYQKSGQRKDAMTSYKAGLKIKPDDHNSHFNLAEMYRLSGFIDKAIDENTIAIRLRPDFAEAHFNLGGLNILKKNYKNAKFHYDQAEKLGLKIAKVTRNQLNSLKKTGP
jgi:4-amino-4-deoxy-L-arabinose transferase-like glycosyltransferase/Flp pilus assembly protein TadD